MPRPPRLLRTLRSFPVLLGLVLSVAGAGLLSLPAGCSGAAQAREQCALDAARALPLDDPDQISVGDARRFGRRIKACLAPPPAPASSPAPDAGG